MAQSWIAEVKDDLKYLGSYISSTEKDIRVRKAQASRALHDFKNICKSAMSDNFKGSLFWASVGTSLLYGPEAWKLTMKQEKRLDG